jgi:hypothetical protein
VDVDDDTAAAVGHGRRVRLADAGLAAPEASADSTAVPQPVLMTAGGVLLGVGELRDGVLHPRKVFT